MLVVSTTFAALPFLRYNRFFSPNPASSCPFDLKVIVTPSSSFCIALQRRFNDPCQEVAPAAPKAKERSMLISDATAPVVFSSSVNIPSTVMPISGMLRSRPARVAKSGTA